MWQFQSSKYVLFNAKQAKLGKTNSPMYHLQQSK